MRPEVPCNKLTVNMRSDTYKRWHKLDPVPKNGEICCVVLGRTLTLYKIGDGVNKFSKLRYVKLDQALRDGYIYGSYVSKRTGVVDIVVEINDSTESVYGNLTEEDLQIETKLIMKS